MLPNPIHAIRGAILVVRGIAELIRGGGGNARTKVSGGMTLILYKVFGGAASRHARHRKEQVKMPDIARSH